MEQRWHAWEDVSPAEQRLAVLHQVRDGVPPIADAFLEDRRDERDGLDLGETKASRKALLGEEPRLGGVSLPSGAR